MKHNYTAKNIRTAEKLSIVRMRPTGFITDKSIDGQVHLIKEPTDNGLDELEEIMRFGVKGKLILMLTPDTKRGTYQMTIVDNGRGVPIEALLDSFTVLYTSGKYDTNAYEASSGLFGVGGKAAAGMSKKFRVITQRGQEGAGSLSIERASYSEEIPVDRTPREATGTTIIMEPDEEIFTDIPLFAESGYLKLIELLQKYCFFRPLDIEFRMHHKPLPQNVWTSDLNDALATIARYIASSHILFSEHMLDRTQWLRDYWKISRPYAWNYQIAKDYTHEGDRLRFDIRFFYVRFDQNGGRFGMVNSVPIDSNRSSHFSVLNTVLRDKIATRIKDNAIRKFFVETYKLPIYIAANIKYKGAEFTGTTKHDFIDKEFSESYYSPALHSLLGTPAGEKALDDLFELAWPDIESKYIQLTVGNTKVQNTHRLFESLNFPLKFSDCELHGQGSELFLVEGDSANSKVGRDAKRQANYALRGKPFNGVTTFENMRQASLRIQRDPIYQDIFRILGLDPQKPDLNNLRYSALLIMTDADSHGYHISEIVVGNLYIVCPELIESGMVHIVTPPLYGIDLVRKGKDTPRVFLRSEDDVIAWTTQNVYMEAFHIDIRTRDDDTPRRLTPREYYGLIKLLLAAGEQIDNIAKELVLDPHILELLTYVTPYLNRGAVDIVRIREVLRGVDKISYDEHGHILIMSIGRDDYVIPLYNVCERLYASILPILQKLAWNKLRIYITSKHSDASAQYTDQLVSVYQLYSLLRQFDGLFSIERYKGLGQMGDDKYITCMDPRYRTTHQITSVGDVKEIFRLLGKESAYRKKLIAIDTD